MNEIEKYINTGQHWRAKELLQGRLNCDVYQPELLESYGRLLLAMHDDAEAGKYLFLSGERKEEYIEPINIFLNKYRNKNRNQMFYTFPRMIKSTCFEELPQALKKEMLKVGVHAWKPRKIQKRSIDKPSSDVTFNIFLFVLVLVFLIGILNGLKTVWDLVVH